MNYAHLSLLTVLFASASLIASNEMPKVDIHHHHHHQTHSKTGFAAWGAGAIQTSERHPGITTLVPVALVTTKILSELSANDNVGKALVVGGALIAWYAAAGLWKTIAQAIMEQNDIEPLRDKK